MTTYSLLSAGMLAGFVMSSASTNVEVPDPSLQQMIRVTLNKPAGSITSADLEALTTLDASRARLGYAAPITTLRGLEFATNLHTLSLQGEYKWGGYLGADPDIVWVEEPPAPGSVAPPPAVALATR